MRYAFLLALSLPLAPAQEAPDAVPAPAVSDERVSVEEAAKPYLELARMHEALLKDLAECLKGVTDEASANAAAPMVAALVDQVRELQAKEAELQELGEPSPEVLAFLARQDGAAGWDQLAQQSMGRAFELLCEEPVCFGSTTLMNALFNLLSLYMGEDAE